jgi:hypothetical protein
LEEEDERVYADFAEGLRKDFPASAAVFDGMRDEESGHRRRLIELFRSRFGEHIPLIRRQDVRGFITRKPVWLVRPLGLNTVRKQAAAMEVESRRFYERRPLSPKTPACGSCWTTWPRRSVHTRIAPRNSEKTSSVQASRVRRTKLTAGCLFCKSFNLVWRV